MKKRILVVEDDTKAAKALSLRLRNSGYEVLIATDGNEGLILAKSYAPDLVITDIWMPVGMGFALAYRLREFTKELPILFITGSSRPGVQQTIKNFGPARLLEKPYGPKDLLAVVGEMLGETTPAKPVGPAPLPRAKTRAPQKADAKKILIVEDDRKIGISLTLRLKSAGYEALLAQDALMGVSMAVKNRPDLLILDVSMPAGDGFQVAARVRGLVPGPMPIIFLTASKQPSFRAKAMELGAAGFFEKPFKSNELLAAIEAALLEQTA
jgi:DNA-binding response OmpR family regulator